MEELIHPEEEVTLSEENPRRWTNKITTEWPRFLSINSQNNNNKNAEDQSNRQQERDWSNSLSVGCFVPLRSISSSNRTADSNNRTPPDSMGSMKRKIYDSAVSTESIYIAHKHEQGWRWKVSYCQNMNLKLQF